MIGTEIGLLHIDDVREKLNKIRLFDKNQALNEIGLKFLNRVRQGFRTSTDPYGNQWPHLKQRRGQPLLDTGTLIKSIRFDVKNNILRIGTGVQYGTYHQNGTARIPKRAFIPDERGLPDNWTAEAVAILERHLFGKEQ